MKHSFFTTGSGVMAKNTVGIAAVAMFLFSASSFSSVALSFPVGFASRQMLPQVFRFDGVVEPVHVATVSAQTSGRIAEILVDVDQFVAKDTVILRLHAKEQEARYAQAQAAVREQQARRQEAEEAFERIERLYQQKLVPKSELDKATAQRDSTQAQLERAQAVANEVSEQVGHTLIRAPYSGVVTERHVQVGETVQAGKPLMTGFSLEELRAVVLVPQSLVNEVRAGARARVYTSPRGPGVTVENLTVFPTAGDGYSFRVRVPLPKGIDRVYPGMLIKVDIVVGESAALVVPAKAVVQRGEVTGVYVVDEPSGRVEFRYVRAGRSLGEDIEVLAGLSEGERVALDPNAAVKTLLQPE